MTRTDRERYQTIFATRPGAVAAPTAGLHFTPAILASLRARGIEVREITLNVGLGTFQPIRTENLEDHEIHAGKLRNSGRDRGGHREPRDASAAQSSPSGPRSSAPWKTPPGRLPREEQRPAMLAAGPAVADLFILPGHRFAIVDQLLTNFHLPRSTLLVLVAAFAGREPVLAAYRHAVAAGYRFYSYGDCMLIR